MASKLAKKWTLENVFPHFMVFSTKSYLVIHDFAIHGFFFPPNTRELRGPPVSNEIYLNKVTKESYFQVEYVNFTKLALTRSLVNSQKAKGPAITLAPKRLMLKLATGGALVSAGSITKYNFK